MKHEDGMECPCCAGTLERYPDQDGACDFECPECGWREHVPGEVTGRPILEGIRIEPELLGRQAALLGRLIGKASLDPDERSSLGGLWELVHSLLDRVGDEQVPAGRPTIFLIVEDGPVREENNETGA
ncbi:MAG: hypothetical protein ACOC7S_00640 [Planctomycetota bacterium]